MNVKHHVSFLISVLLFSLPVAALAEPPNPPPGAPNNLEARLALLEELVVGLQEQLDALPHISFRAGFDYSHEADCNGRVDRMPEVHNDGGAYEMYTGLFTAPTDGAYHFDLTLRYAVPADCGSGVGVGLKVNGVFPLAGEVFILQSGGAALGITLKLSAGDTVGVYFYGITYSGVSFSGYQVY